MGRFGSDAHESGGLPGGDSFGNDVRDAVCDDFPVEGGVMVGEVHDELIAFVDQGGIGFNCPIGIVTLLWSAPGVIGFNCPMGRVMVLAYMG